MAALLPQTDARRFTSIDLAAVVCAFLFKSSSVITVRTLRSKLSTFTKPNSLDRVAKQLITKGDVSLQGDKLQLTESGKAAARAVLGNEVTKSWEHIRDRR